MSGVRERAAGEPGVVGAFEASLDRAVDEVFSTMLGVACAPATSELRIDGSQISAVIGLAGALSGSLVLRTSGAAAMRMAERMMGIAPPEVDSMVHDAVGEVCNMVAGAWKGFDSTLASGCLLSTPTVVAGTSYELFSQRAPIRIDRSYGFDDRTFAITLSCELDA